MTKLTFRVSRKYSKTGKTYKYVPTLNGHRLTKTNFGRHGDAVKLIKAVNAKFSDDELRAMIAKKAA